MPGRVGPPEAVQEWSILAPTPGPGIHGTLLSVEALAHLSASAARGLLPV